MPPTYRRRLRAEGMTLAASGGIGSAVLLVAATDATGNALSTAVQLGVVLALLLWLGPRSVHNAIAGAERRARLGLGNGEPTPLWQLPLIVIGLSVLVGVPAGWDAGLRVTLGCVLVGLVQAYLLERIVALNESTSGRTYFRIEGSRILRGTRLGYVEG